MQVKKIKHSSKTFSFKTSAQEDGKLKCSTSCLHIFSTFSSNFLQIFQMTKMKCFHNRSTNVCKNTVKVKAAFCSDEFLLRKMGKSAARLLRQPILYLLWQCPWNISYSISFVCVCVRVCVCVLGWLSQLVPQQPCEWLKTTPRCVYKMVRRPCNILLMAEVNAASNNNWTCEASWRQEAENVKQQVVLRDPASTAENNHRDYLHRCHAGFRSFLSASSNCHPAKRRVLTTQRARKTQCDFGGKFHPHLQRIGNTERARLLEVDVDQWRCYGQFHFLFNRLTAETIPQGSGGNTFNEHHSAFFTTNSSVEQVDWPHSHTTNHKFTAHVADKETLLINCHCTLN